jgi:hypothetical protein
MNHQVQVFEIDTATKPTEPLRPIDGFAVTAETLDEARLAATERLRSDGRVVRCLSFLKDGGLAAVVYPPAPPETKPDKRRRGRNGGR